MHTSRSNENSFLTDAFVTDGGLIFSFMITKVL